MGKFLVNFWVNVFHRSIGWVFVWDVFFVASFLLHSQRRRRWWYRSWLHGLSRWRRVRFLWPAVDIDYDGIGFVDNDKIDAVRALYDGSEVFSVVSSEVITMRILKLFMITDHILKLVVICMAFIIALMEEVLITLTLMDNMNFMMVI